MILPETAARSSADPMGCCHGHQKHHEPSPRQYPDFRALCGDASDNIPGVRGVGAKTAATLLAGGLALDDLPASGRLSGGKGAAISAAWPEVLTWRSMIRLDTSIPVPASPEGVPTVPLPIPGQVIARLGLWRRTPPAAVARAAAAQGTLL